MQDCRTFVICLTFVKNLPPLLAEAGVLDTGGGEGGVERIPEKERV